MISHSESQELWSSSAGWIWFVVFEEVLVLALGSLALFPLSSPLRSYCAAWVDDVMATGFPRNRWSGEHQPNVSFHVLLVTQTTLVRCERDQIGHSMAGTGSGWSQELVVSTGSSMWVAGAQHLSHCLLSQAHCKGGGSGVGHLGVDSSPIWIAGRGPVI